ncbi:hypothetical protein [Chromobacterium sp. IIBBL 290-4]|uniref:hypothetical protein n=1 Tax=Chromobacterium sp. IIBBL 290-4 TaxID=2953890 RepID=UPI0020B82976|nr:hypothetical protein [Chromobacterium sp. IIBBL 290-4]UTH72803.1 hypothetical protein NKT35_14795 [Chromobacterium sp. IIBBL 290-4]
MDLQALKQEPVRRAIAALQAGDLAAWLAAFQADAKLFDDGSPRDFHAFSREALGHERFISLSRISADGLEISGPFHTEQWGDFPAYFRFAVAQDGKISRLDIGQA